MARLALLAVLLLALAPTLGRVLVAGTPQVLAGWSEMCTSGGLKLLPSPARLADGKAPPAEAHGGDCPYCPLGAGLALPPQYTGPAAIAAGTAAASRHAVPRRRFARLHGPGSRGPPLQA